MERSIELMWKEGFLNSDQLVAPKINSLYSQKSQSIIAKIKRMMKINHIALVVFSLVVLVWWYFINAFYIGLFIFVALNAFVLYAKHQMDKLSEVDQSMSSYDYLKQFDHRIKTSMAHLAKVMRVFYPAMFIAAVATIWFSNDNSAVLTELFANNFPELTTLGGVPAVGLIIVLAIAVCMSFFAGKIYKWDVNLVYGRVFKKLDEIIADMEELRS